MLKIKRYGLGRDYSGRIGCPAIIEKDDGEYVRFEDHKSLVVAYDAHNEMMILRAQQATNKTNTTDAARYRSIRAASCTNDVAALDRIEAHARTFADPARPTPQEFDSMADLLTPQGSQ